MEIIGNIEFDQHLHLFIEDSAFSFCFIDQNNDPPAVPLQSLRNELVTYTVNSHTHTHEGIIWFYLAQNEAGILKTNRIWDFNNFRSDDTFPSDSTEETPLQ